MPKANPHLQRTPHAKVLSLLVALTLLLFTSTAPVPDAPAPAAKPDFHVLAFYSTTVEKGHVLFAQQAITFYTKLAKEKNFTFETATDMKFLNSENLKNYQVVMWLNVTGPNSPQQQKAFEDYMQNGGGWIGHHVAGYNDHSDHWKWFVKFFGGAVFEYNNWPPMPALLDVDTNDHPVTANIPAKYNAPANEFYRWDPSPRKDPNVKVLVTLDPSNFPFGKKDVLTSGDMPVVWTNTRFNMIYINMGHGDKVLDSDIQNQLFADALLWVGHNAGKPVKGFTPEELAALHPATQPASAK